MFLDCIGSIAWWARRVQVDEEVSIAFGFQKQSSASQYIILGPNGKVQHSVPTVKKTRKGPMDLVEIANQESWQTEQWRSIETAYSKAPFFIYYNYKLEPVFKTNYHKLWEFNWAMYKAIAACLRIETTDVPVREGEGYYKELTEGEYSVYPQVFDDRFEFVAGAGILDLLFNLGPETADYLRDYSANS